MSGCVGSRPYSSSKKGKRLIGYANRSLNVHDFEAHSSSLECMALHWTVRAKLAIYLHGGHQFNVVTHHMSLTYLMKKSTINRIFARWTPDLAEYEFDLVRRPVKLNSAADEMSRLSVPDRALEDLIGKVESGCIIKRFSVVWRQDSYVRSYEAPNLRCQ